MPEQVILTGGVKTAHNVTVYNREGFLEDLPNLKEARFRHGCGHYINTDKKVVSGQILTSPINEGNCFLPGY